LVHEQEVRSNIEAYLYQLKDIVEVLMRYHLVRGREHPSLAQAAVFLDTPVEGEIFKKRILQVCETATRP
jgi:hypothetical protein